MLFFADKENTREANPLFVVYYNCLILSEL